MHEIPDARKCLVTLTNLSSAISTYVQDLFDTYARDYDAHVKKLLFAAPRVIRQEVAAIYKADGAFNFADATTWGNDQDRVAALAADGEGNTPHPHEERSDTAAEACPEASETTQADSGCGIAPPGVSGPLHVLDLGCGTGLAGSWVKDYAKSLTGVDVSSEMLACARKKGLYASLVHADMTEWLSRESPEAFWDLIIAADSFAYLGDLSRVIQSAARALKPGGLLVFTCEAVPAHLLPSSCSSTHTHTHTPIAPFLGERGFRLLPSGRFGHSQAYIDAVVAQGFLAATSAGGGAAGRMDEDEDGAPSHRIRQRRAFSPRLESGEPLPGWLYIVQRR